MNKRIKKKQRDKRQRGGVSHAKFKRRRAEYLAWCIANNTTPRLEMEKAMKEYAKELEAYLYMGEVNIIGRIAKRQDDPNVVTLKPRVTTYTPFD